MDDCLPSNGVDDENNKTITGDVINPMDSFQLNYGSSESLEMDMVEEEVMNHNISINSAQHNPFDIFQNHHEWSATSAKFFIREHEE